jgi:hypothetical protein
LVAALALTTGACGGGGSSSSKGSVNPTTTEPVQPGDIPDNQAFVRYAPPGGGYSIVVPEGWGMRSLADGIEFSDKYNSVRIAATGGRSAPTVAAMKSKGLGDVSGDPSLRVIAVKKVHRPAGDGIEAIFEVRSSPNAVTSRRATLQVERYAFAHGAKTVTLTLSGAKGADNVDPWRRVTDSLRWR